MTRTENFRAHALFMSPAILIGIAIVLPPLLYIVYTSLHGPEWSSTSIRAVLASTLFRQTLGNTLYISGMSAVVSVVLGFIIALHLARQPPRRRAYLMILVLLPFWTSVLVKSFAFMLLLGREGIVNNALSWVFQTRVELPLMLNSFGLLVGMTSYLTPLVVLPVLASLLAIDETIYRAAAVMGAKPARIFLTVTLPLSVPGLLAALLSVFVLSLGAFVIPALLGGPRDVMLSNLVDFYNRQVLDWPKASSIGVVLLGMASLVAASLAFLRRRKV